MGESIESPAPFVASSLNSAAPVEWKEIMGLRPSLISFSVSSTT